jgi:hypothetical protein
MVEPRGFEPLTPTMPLWSCSRYLLENNEAFSRLPFVAKLLLQVVNLIGEVMRCRADGDYHGSASENGPGLNRYPGDCEGETCDHKKIHHRTKLVWHFMGWCALISTKICWVRLDRRNCNFPLWNQPCSRSLGRGLVAFPQGCCRPRRLRAESRSFFPAAKLLLLFTSPGVGQRLSGRMGNMDIR